MAQNLGLDLLDDLLSAARHVEETPGTEARCEDLSESFFKKVASLTCFFFPAALSSLPSLITCPANRYHPPWLVFLLTSV
jgi:hypothetical protein